MTDETEAPDEVQEEPDSRPLLKIIKGNATPEEVAAIVAVLAALGGRAEPPRRRTPEWAAHHRKVRATHPHGPGGWRSSSLPR